MHVCRLQQQVGDYTLKCKGPCEVQRLASENRGLADRQRELEE